MQTRTASSRSNEFSVWTVSAGTGQFLSCRSSRAPASLNPHVVAVAGSVKADPVIGVVVEATLTRSGAFASLNSEKSQETVVAGRLAPTWQSVPPGVAGSQTSSQMF